MAVAPDPHRTGRRLRAMVSLLALGALAGMLAGVLIISARAADGAAEDQRRFWAYSAWVSTAMLSLTLVALVWLLARFLRAELRLSRRRRKLPYVNAWELSAQRLDLEDADLGEPESDEDDRPPDRWRE